MTRKNHWEQVYTAKPAERLGWYKPNLQTSLQWIRDLGLPRNAPIIDVGGGASTLVDDLLTDGYESITVLDIAASALQQLRERLGKKGTGITWICADITAVDLPPHAYALWHDRAAFHFLTDAGDIARYRDRLLTALRPGGYVIIGTFAPQAPPQCSGLPVRRYDHEALARALGAEFTLLRHHEELHVTPGGVEQMYSYCTFQRRGD